MTDLKHFLVVFDRADGRLLRVDEYLDPREAMSARFSAERLHRHSPNIEIVVLGAKSETALHRTHARYFEDVPALARRTADLVRGTSSTFVA